MKNKTTKVKRLQSFPKILKICFFINFILLNTFLVQGQLKGVQYFMKDRNLPVNSGGYILLSLFNDPGIYYDNNKVGISIKNATSDVLEVEIEFSASSIGGRKETWTAGSSSKGGTIINPGKTLGGEENYCQYDFALNNKNSPFKNDPKINPVSGMEYRIIKIVNISENERKEAKEKAATEKQQQELAEKNAQAKQDALAKQASLDEQKQNAEKEATARQEKARRANEKVQQQNDYTRQANKQEQERKEAQQEDYKRRVDAEAERKRDFNEKQKTATNNYINQQNAAVQSDLNDMDALKEKLNSMMNKNTTNNSSDEDDERERENRRNEYKRKTAEKESKDQLTSNRKSLLDKIPQATMPVYSQTKNASEVYFFIYSCDYFSLSNDNPMIYLSNIFTVGKYGDDTWPFIDKVKEKIALANKGFNYKLSGFYLTKEAADGELQELVNNAYKYDLTIKNVFCTYAKTKTNSDTDFWGNKTTSKEQQVKTEVSKQQNTAKAEYDDWGNPIAKKTEQPKTTTAKKTSSSKATATTKVEYDDWGNPIKK